MTPCQYEVLFGHVATICTSVVGVGRKTERAEAAHEVDACLRQSLAQVPGWSLPE